MRRLLAVVLLGLLPWTVIVGPATIDLVFLWGLVDPAGRHVVTLWDYLLVYTAGLPDRLLAWPASALLYLGALLAALAEAAGLDDWRLAPGLLALAAVAHLGFALGAARRGSGTVVPVGPILVGLVLWWFYWPTIRRELAGER